MNSSPLSHHEALRVDGNTAQTLRETLAEETAVALLFNGVPHVVMMATPADLEDFAGGFALTEGIVEHVEELRVIDCLPREHGIALHLSIPAARFAALQARQRNLVGRSGCGLCGAETLEDAIRPVRRVDSGAHIAAAVLLGGFERLAQSQPLNRECGSLHAAAAICGDEFVVREDVGRHNALDKVIGALARSHQAADAVLVTSRASYELVHKTAQAGIGVLAAVSGPTAFAVRLARESGLTLIGFARGARMNIYTHPERVLLR